MKESIREVIMFGEYVYLKKDFLGWRMVYPIKNKDGSTNWMNLIFGGKRNLFILIGVLLFLGLLFLGFNEVVSSCRMIAENPCDFCTTQSNFFTLNKI